MNKLTATTERMNKLLRGELAAIETYQQAIEKFAGHQSAADLRRLQSEHRTAAEALRDMIRRHGSEPSVSSGSWGTFANVVESVTKILGKDSAVEALHQGEKHGVEQFEEALEEPRLEADCKSLIRSQLLPQAQARLAVLKRLRKGI